MKKKTTQRILIIVLAIALLVTIVMPLLSVLASGAITQDDINDIKGELAEITALKKKIQKELNAIRGDLSKAKEQIALIQGQITLTEQQIAESQRLLDRYDLEIQDKEEEIADLEAQEAAQYEEFYSQVRWMEETGSVSYLSIFFEASSFAEMLDYAMLITDIMDYSDRIITRLEATQKQIGEARIELQATRETQAQAHDELEGQKTQLESEKKEADVLYSSISASEAELAAKAKQLAADEAAMAKELKDAEKKYAEQIAALNNSGAWAWPLPGYYKISSIFGGRYHPITGRWETHTGTDIPAPGGTKILAAQGGIVTVSKYNASYGNYCMISHGNGQVTLYAHMKQRPLVKEGQSVKKGQVIGYVGTTGSSTGNHLHFELRVNGNRDNVLRLYPNLPYTGPYVSTIKKQLGIK